MSTVSTKCRLDQLLVQRGMATTRSRARDMVARGCVTVDGRTADKAGQIVSDSSAVCIDDPAEKYVSRAALKLVAGLDEAAINVDGCHAVDLGSSTGGFTQVLIERGAASVLAIDVGHGQMAPEIAGHPNVTNVEGLNARSLTAEHFDHPVDLVVSDLSFVSLTIAAEPTLLVAAPSAHCVLLVKPQFEVGREGVGKGGLVTDQNLIDTTVQRLVDWLNGLPGWRVTHLLPSPIYGGDGNREFLLCGVRDA